MANKLQSIAENRLTHSAIEGINPKWDFGSRTSMNFSCLINSDIQLIMLITLLFAGNYPYK